MGVVSIQTVLNDDTEFWFQIEVEDLRMINCPVRRIESLDKIYQICVIDHLLVITKEDRGFRDGRSYLSPSDIDERSINNVDVYDWDGNHLWNIGDIVGDIKMPFDSVAHISQKRAREEFDIAINAYTGPLFQCIAAGFVYIIDASKRKLLGKFSGRVK